MCIDILRASHIGLAQGLQHAKEGPAYDIFSLFVFLHYQLFCVYQICPFCFKSGIYVTAPSLSFLTLLCIVTIGWCHQTSFVQHSAQLIRIVLLNLLPFLVSCPWTVFASGMYIHSKIVLFSPRHSLCYFIDCELAIFIKIFL